MAPTPKTARTMQKKKIFFNSKVGGKFKALSNFYGSSEYNFHIQRFKLTNTIPNLLRKVCRESQNSAKFIEMLKQLQPNKKWTEKKEKYWFENGKPIRGILAKLIMNKSKRISTRSNGWKKDLEVLNSFVKSKDLTQDDFVLHDSSCDPGFMKKALLHKFNRKKYRDILEATGSAKLHEFSRHPGRWGLTKGGQGGDLLGKTLTVVREVIISRKIVN
tara:strand:+ start:2087 stop:2737 length:651 start_codon:yes stop_codon:yes gene_type:complete